MRATRHSARASSADARQRLADALAVARPIPHLVVDGLDLSGRVFFWKCSTFRLTGPGLMLSPGTSPSDGRLDVVYATASDLGPMIDWLRAGAIAERVPALARRGGASLGIEWSGAAIRIDDEFPPLTEGRVRLRLRTSCASIVAPSAKVRPGRSTGPRQAASRG